jgi:tetraspanin-13/31
MCGGFNFSKSALTALNIIYILVGFILIGVATYAKAASVVTSLPIIGGIVACGVFLVMIAVMGLIGAIKHHQVLLFFYMVVLFILFIIQFSIACACLAVDDQTQITLATTGWDNSNNATIHEVQELFSCCGFRNSTIADQCPKSCGDKCPPCLTKLQSIINYGFRVSGGIGLFFSFTEILGFSIAYRFRNMAYTTV